MKIRFILLGLLIWLASTASVAQSYLSAQSTDEEDIVLAEEISKGLRSSYIPITATLGNSTIYINFEDAMGDLKIIINKLNETVYASSLRVEAPSQEIIDVDAYDPGIYLLKFTKAGGESIYGYFTIE